jgi:hypothetical protein
MSDFPTRLAAGLAILLSAAGAAQAATLIVTPTVVNTSFSSFQIGYTDRNGNGLIDFTEMTSFSGVNQTEFSQFPAYQEFIVAMPAIAGISTGGAFPGIDNAANLWMFSAAGETSVQTLAEVGQFTYAIAPSPGPGDPPPAPIPLPASALLLGAAIGGLALARRRRAAA